MDTSKLIAASAALKQAADAFMQISDELQEHEVIIQELTSRQEKEAEVKKKLLNLLSEYSFND